MINHGPAQPAPAVDDDNLREVYRTRMPWDDEVTPRTPRPPTSPLPKPRLCRSGGMLVFVEDAAEAIASSYIEAVRLVWVDNRRG